MGMDGTFLSAAETAEYVEFKRTRREAEISFTLKRLVVDASRRETDRAALKSAVSTAEKLGACGILVSPVNVVPARRLKNSEALRIVCLVGGTGESLPATKKSEAKRALKGGAGEVRLVLCYSALMGGNFSYLKREVAKLRRAVKKRPLVVSLEDHSLGEKEIALGVRAAIEGKADGVCVRGETELLLRALRAAAGRLFVECAEVENAEQLKMLLRAGASRFSTLFGERISDELYENARSVFVKAEPPVSQDGGLHAETNA